MVITTYSAEETTGFGEKFASRLKEGDNLLLLGELGAGKTTFLKGLGRGLGIDKDIVSPTFQLVRKYPASKEREFVHIDLYRLNSVEDILRIGWMDIVEGPEIAAVEWAERAKDIWPERGYSIKLTVESKSQRKIEVSKL